MTPIDQLNVKMFADGADKAGMLEMPSLLSRVYYESTLMRKAEGITDYKGVRQGNPSGNPRPPHFL